MDHNLLAHIIVGVLGILWSMKSPANILIKMLLLVSAGYGIVKLFS